MARCVINMTETIDEQDLYIQQANEKVAFLQDKLDLAVADTIQLQNETFSHKEEEAAQQQELQEAKDNAKEKLYAAIQAYSELTDENISVYIGQGENIEA